ncbi:MAG TPA: DNA topoisomerase (ATP-hydrolyzing) [Acidimicrobiales bacterium]
MSPRTKKTKHPGPTLLDAEIETKAFNEHVESAFLEYAMSVIVGRALPDVRDGLKPVHRRILWAMHEAGYRPDRNYVKCARVVGDVMGTFHPHGDQSIYDALVRMGQPFSMRLPLIDAHGNFGSPSDPPAAMRYTECRLDEAAMALLQGIDESTVDLATNFDGSSEEPVVLPARFPNLLVNGSEGIAVGMATKIPPHNLAEVCAAAEAMIDQPDMTTARLLKKIKGPDFPTGGRIMGGDGLREAYETGRGTIRLRATVEVKEAHKGDEIIVTEIPYQTSVDQIAEKAAELVEEGKIGDVRDIRNESANGETRLVIELRPGANTPVVLNNLYKHTPLQTTFGINMVALVDGVPRTLSVRDLLTEWVRHSEEVIRRRSQFRLDKAEARLHIVDGLLRAIDLLDEIITLIRASKDRAAARLGLMGNDFAFTEIQANHILDLPLGRLTQLGTQELADEAKALKKTIRDLKKILKDRGVLLGVIKDELFEIRQRHQTPRRTVLDDDTGDIEVTELVDDEPLTITITARGYVKAISKRSRGKQVADPGDHDAVAQVIDTSALGSVVFFTDAGKCYKAEGHEVPKKKLTAAPNLFQFSSNEQVVAVMDGAEADAVGLVGFVTAKGQTKTVEAGEFTEAAGRRDGLVAMKLAEGDRVAAVFGVPQDGSATEMVVATAEGQGIRFSLEEVRPMGRSAGGVRAIRLKGDDRVVGAAAVGPVDETVLVATSRGYAKRTRIDDLNVQRRGGGGLRLARLNVKTGSVAGVLAADVRSGFAVLGDAAAASFMGGSAGLKPRESGGVALDGVDFEVQRVVGVQAGDIAVNGNGGDP